jgi:hypothetical protein
VFLFDPGRQNEIDKFGLFINYQTGGSIMVATSSSDFEAIFEYTK